ncbi:MAG: acyltransferase family protein [Crocinitomix sp.]|nr:acyltransferase family protein [Crocinitomix sp.]
MDKKNDHILIINSLRGLAATAVCFYHFIVTTQDYVTDETLLSIFEFGDRGVQLFFIISGIVIPLSMINSAYTLKKWKSFILKRFIRIEPPYLVAVAIGIIYLIARNYVPGTVAVDLTPSFTEIVLHLGYLIPFVENANWVNPVFWTLAVEFQYYLALSVLFPLVLTGKLFYRSIFYAIFIGGGFATLSYAFFPHWSPYFLVGIIYILMRKEVITKLEFGIVAAVLAPIIYINLGPVDLGIAIVSLLLIHYLSNFKTKLTLFLGKISYSLYLLHSMLGAAFINYLSHSYKEPYQKFIVISLGFAISVGSAYILYRFVEKPSHKWAKKIGQ